MEKVIFVTGDVSQKSSKDLEGVGTLRWVDNQLYEWVQNGNTATHAAAGTVAIGDVAYYKAANGEDLHKKVYNLAAATIANVGLMAGVHMSSLATLEYGWILKLGNAETINMNASGTTAIAAGDFVGGTTAATTADYAVFKGKSTDLTQSQQTITDSAGGTTSTTLAACTTTVVYTVVNNNITSIAAQLALIQADVAALIAQKNNSGIIALEALASSVTVTTAVRGFVRCL